LTAYQRRLREGSDCPPLSGAEIRYLPHLINAGNVYVLYWSLRDYFGKPVDPEEYLVYLRHGVAFARWFDVPTNRQKLAATVANLPHPF
jgi:homoserine kinase type II